jgi:hypothetical protein
LAVSLSSAITNSPKKHVKNNENAPSGAQPTTANIRMAYGFHEMGTALDSGETGKNGCKMSSGIGSFRVPTSYGNPLIVTTSLLSEY